MQTPAIHPQKVYRNSFRVKQNHHQKLWRFQVLEQKPKPFWLDGNRAGMFLLITQYLWITSSCNTPEHGISSLLLTYISRSLMTHSQGGGGICFIWGFLWRPVILNPDIWKLRNNSERLGGKGGVPKHIGGHPIWALIICEEKGSKKPRSAVITYLKALYIGLNQQT